MHKDSITDIIAPIALLLFTVAGLVGWICLFVSRARSLLPAWAAENGFQIVIIHKRGWNRAGPFWGWGNAHNRVIYFVRVRDLQGRERDCWVRFRIWFGKQIDVRWVDE